MTEETFNVAIWFPNGMWEYVARDLDPKTAVETAKEYCERPAAEAGLIVKVVITDSGDYTNFQWEFGKGVTYPVPGQGEDDDD